MVMRGKEAAWFLVRVVVDGLPLIFYSELT